MYNPLQNAGVFLVKIIFNLYIYLVLIRFLLQWFRADFYNPICQLIIKATNPILVPLRKIIPGFMGLDLAAILLLFILEFCQLNSIMLIVAHKFISLHFWNIVGIFILSAGQIIDHAVSLFTFSIIIFAIISWFPNVGYNPLFTLLYTISAPLLRFAKRMLPMTVVGGMDMSPIIVLIVLQLFNFLFTDTMIYYGRLMIIR